MGKKAQRSNKQFLLGTGALAFGIICIVLIFTMTWVKWNHSQVDNQAYGDIYQIELVQGFIGDSAIIYINDSLLWNGKVETDTMKLSVERFSEQNMLMVSDPQLDITSSFNITNNGARIILRKSKEIISMTEVAWK